MVENLNTKYLEFRHLSDSKSGKTKLWGIFSMSSGIRLGKVEWHGAWRQYTFMPDRQTIWNHACLAAVEVFLKTVNDAHKSEPMLVQILDAQGLPEQVFHSAEV